MNKQIVLIRAVILIVMLGAWEIVGRTANPALYVPPSAAIPALGRLLTLHSYPDLLEHLLLTLREILVAYAMAIAAGLGAGFALGVNRLVGRAYHPAVGRLATDGLFPGGRGLVARRDGPRRRRRDARP